MTTLLGRILINRQLPGKREILQSTGRGLKSIAANPIKAVKEGLSRDKLAVNTYKSVTGQSRRQAAGNLAKKVAKGIYAGGGKDMLVNTGGLIGSIKGSVIGGKIGSLAGDWAGAATARKGLDDLEATNKAFKIRNNPNFRKQPLNIKARILAKRVVRNTRNIGRIEAAGTGVRKGIISTNRNLSKSLNPSKKIKAGLNREQRMYGSINNNLTKLPRVPAGVSFNSHHLLSDFITSNTK